MSAGPPAANGTMIFTGLVGHCCAATGTASAANAATRMRGSFMGALLRRGRRHRSKPAPGRSPPCASRRGAGKGRRAWRRVQGVEPRKQSGMAERAFIAGHEIAEHAAILEALRREEAPGGLERIAPDDA